MNGKLLWIGSGLIVCVIAVLWLLSGSGAGPERAGSAASETTRREALARPGPLPPGTTAAQRKGSAAADPGVPAARGGDSPDVARPRTLPAAAAAPSARRGNPKELEFVASLFRPPSRGATPLDLQAWEESALADLIYPNDHPCAGLPREGVSPESLQSAAEEILAPKIENIPEIDRPQCHIQGNWPFHPLNQCARSLNREDPESVAQFMACLDGVPQDPSAYPASIWVPCPESHPQVTTMRQHYQAQVSQYVNELLSRPPCRP